MLLFSCASRLLAPAAAWLLCATLIAGGCKRQTPTGQQQRRGDVVLQVETLRVTPAPFHEKLSATGSLEADEQVMLRPEVSGIIEEIAFTEGEQVEPGRVLVRLRAEDLRAQLERAEAQLKLAEAANERQQQLIKRQAVSRAEVDEAAASLAVARAEVALAAAELAKTEVRTPFDGVIGLRAVSVGEYVTPTTDIASFRRLDPLKLEVSIPERYRSYLRDGLDVAFSVAGAREQFKGEVYAIEPGIDPATRTIRLRARVPNAERALAPGAFVEAEIVLDRIEKAILIPALAVVPGIKDETVFVIEDGVARSRPIVTGLRTRDSVLVQQGLEPGDEVILSSILQLRPGMKVRAIPPEPKAKPPASAGGAST